MNKYPLITIGMACFNAQDTIEKALQSAIDQNYPNFEIVIYDDFSTDDSVSLVNKKVKNSSKIRFIKGNKNLGVAAARNIIIRNAEGEFIALFDDDDYSCSSRLMTQYKKIIDYESVHNTDLIACWTSGYKIYDNGYKVEFQAIGSKPEIPVGEDILNYQLYMNRDPRIFYGSGTPSCSMMIRKSVFDKVGLYDETMKRIEDTDFVIRLGILGGHFIGCAEHLVYQKSTNGDDKRPEVAYESEINLIEKYKNLLDTPRRVQCAKEWAKLRFYHFSGNRLKVIVSMIILFLKYPVWTWKKFITVVPTRIFHERKMKSS